MKVQIFTKVMTLSLLITSTIIPAQDLGDNSCPAGTVFVKGGTFTMGCTREQDSDCWDDEKPTQSVTVSDFCIGVAPVTQKEWLDIMGTTVQEQSRKTVAASKAEVEGLYAQLREQEAAAQRQSIDNQRLLGQMRNQERAEKMQRHLESDKRRTQELKKNLEEQLSITEIVAGVGDNYPMYFVDWNDANEYARRLSRATGLKYRLPTEAEWEYAARGGPASKGYIYSGSNNADAVAWWGGFGNGTNEVCKKSKNELGLCDMSGNVWEWVSDWFGVYSSEPKTNPKGPSCNNASARERTGGRGGKERVARGGSWSENPEVCRVSSRYSFAPSMQDYTLGFRVVHVPGAELTETEEKDACDEDVRKAVWTSPQIPKGQGTEMVFVKGGTFTMGCTSEQGRDCRGNEKPARSVTVGDFYIGKAPITQKEWYDVMGTNPSKKRGVGNNYPVYNVSWDDAREFIKRLNQLTGKKYRLLTEAEWEYAARGGPAPDGYKYSGSDNINNVACVYCGLSTYEVCQKDTNKLGLCDMSGNVREWVYDWSGKYKYLPLVEPTGPVKGSNRVTRGGGFADGPKSCRVSSRKHYTPSARVEFIGFRIALSP
jgi:formylglycine-generating enzyme required for sulfatase activity